jgi:hypothetical protein
MIDFSDPGPEHRMLQIIHGMGRFVEALPNGLPGLARLLRERGYGGAVIDVDFSETYLENGAEWETFLDGFRALRDQGLRVWLYDERGYPSLKAGGIVLRDRPDLEAVGLACVRRRNSEPLMGDPELDPEPLAAVRVRQREDGTCDYAAIEEVAWPTHTEPGWAYFTFHRRTMYEGTHCVSNYCDTLRYPNLIDPEATAHFLRVTHDAYARWLGEGLAEVEAFFTDEPSLMTVYLKPSATPQPVVPWSRSFAAEFRELTGQAPWRRLPLLFGNGGVDGLYARVQFWGAVSNLVERHFYGQLEGWCAEHGVASSGHALWEEHLYWQVGFEGDLYRALRRMHIPGIDILSSWPDELARSNAIPIPKFVSSVAHLSGRRHCMSETSSHAQRMNAQPVSFEQRVGTINWQYALGVNLITSYYGLDEMPPNDMRRFNDHIGRLGAVLTPGRHVADVAVYYPIATAWAAYQPTEVALQPPGAESLRVQQTFAETCNTLLRRQRDYDIVDDQAIAEMQSARSVLRLQGEAFRWVVVPGANVMPLATFRKLAQFAADGGGLIFVEPAPAYGFTPAETHAMGEMWPGLLDAKRVFRVGSAAEALAVLGAHARPDLVLETSDEMILYCHRQPEPGVDVYFITNCGPAPVEHRLRLRTPGISRLWQPTTGDQRRAEVQSVGGDSQVRLVLAPYEGVFLL